MKTPTSTTRDPKRIATAIDILRQRFGDRLQTGEAIRRQHANTLTWLENQPPDAVVFVENATEVADVVRIAREHKVPIIPFGAGTSLEGHINAPFGGISIDFARMNQHSARSTSVISIASSSPASRASS